MKIKTREINGTRCKKEDRTMEILFSHYGFEIDCGFIDYEERIELAKHLSDVIEDLLYELEDQPTNDEVVPPSEQERDIQEQLEYEYKHGFVDGLKSAKKKEG